MRYCLDNYLILDDFNKLKPFYVNKSLLKNLNFDVFDIIVKLSEKIELEKEDNFSFTVYKFLLSWKYVGYIHTTRWNHTVNIDTFVTSSAFFNKHFLKSDYSDVLQKEINQLSCVKIPLLGSIILYKFISFVKEKSFCNEITWSSYDYPELEKFYCKNCKLFKQKWFIKDFEDIVLFRVIL